MDTLSLALIFSAVSQQYALPEGLLSAICFVESSHRQVITYKDGGSNSYSICQVKLATARYLGFKGNYKDLIKPEININLAGQYLKYQLKRYNGNYARAITAYNKGNSNSHGGSEYLAKVFNQWIREIK